MGQQPVGGFLVAVQDLDHAVRQAGILKHIYGPEGVSFYTRGKVATSRWPEPTHASGASYNFPSN